MMMMMMMMMMTMIMLSYKLFKCDLYCNVKVLMQYLERLLCTLSSVSSADTHCPSLIQVSAIHTDADETVVAVV